MKTAVDVTLLLEGTYPYVAGGVSTWVHQLLEAYPERSFSLLHIGPHPNAFGAPRFQLPPNVHELVEAHCRGPAPIERGRRGRRRVASPPRACNRPSRTLAAIGRLHLGEPVDDALIADLAAADLSIEELLHGRAAFDLLRNELYPRLSPDAPFMDVFWHFRAMHVPLLRMLASTSPPARVYHAVSTGYAGLVGAVASQRTGMPFVLTEHGLYAREREIELARATWIRDHDDLALSRPSPLRRIWAHYFKTLSRIAYHQATRVITLCETNRGRQLADGADPTKIAVVPNGVDQATFRPVAAPTAPTVGDPKDRTNGRDPGDRPMRVGFVGRVVPIKDVITLIRACGLALDQVDLEVWIVGPQDEDPAYAQRCRDLVAVMGLEQKISFLGPRPAADMYRQLDVVVLTSISEGQPLVILEAHASAVPVVATDVGACRELIEGAPGADCGLGPSGVVTRVANPAETGAALVYLARNPGERRRMGRNGLARVTARYQQCNVVDQYNSLYAQVAS